MLLTNRKKKKACKESFVSNGTKESEPNLPLLRQTQSAIHQRISRLTRPLTDAQK